MSWPLYTDLYSPALPGLSPEEERRDAGQDAAQQAAEDPRLAHVLRILVDQAALAPRPTTAWPVQKHRNKTLDCRHWPKTNLNLRLKTGPVTAGADATVYVRHLFPYSWSRNQTATVASAPTVTMTGSVFRQRFRIFWDSVAVQGMKVWTST